MVEVLIVGAGFSGAAIARVLAENGLRVRILEQRPHIGGNMYERTDENGVRSHVYGPHIFHTNSERVFAFLRRFSDFFPYEHRVLGRIDGKLVPIPFNFTSLETLFPAQQAKRLEERLLAAYPGGEKISILDLTSSGDGELRAFGDYVFDRVFVHYTAKQWQQPVEEVDASVINRVPVVLGYDDRYFGDKIQAMPADGYTALFGRMLDHPNIALELSCDALGRLSLREGKLYLDGKEFPGPVVYTGAPDALLGYRFGPLPYRSLEFVFEQLELDSFQPAAVVNYPNEEDFTRITESKKLTGQVLPGRTTILREYPAAYAPGAARGGIPYYPVPNEANRALYERYRGALAAYPGGMQIGGGITAENAAGYLEAGASHVIVTSYVFRDGSFCRENMEKLVSEAGREHIVLDLSCRKRDGAYYIVTDRWQKFTEECLDFQTLTELSGYCDEFLIHGVDVEGRRAGMEEELVHMLGEWDGVPVTYAGGIGREEDLERFRELSGGRLDFTIGSALDLFGGNIPYDMVRRYGSR